MKRPVVVALPRTVQDLAAAVVSVTLVVGIVVLKLAGKEVPSELAAALGASITWLFVRSSQEAQAIHYPPEFYLDDARE